MKLLTRPGDVPSLCLRCSPTAIASLSLFIYLHLSFRRLGNSSRPLKVQAIPMLVGEHELTPALSLFNVTFMLSQALGYVLRAPIALNVLPTFNILGVTIDAFVELNTLIAILYLVCAFLIMAIPAPAFTQPCFAYRRQNRISFRQTLEHLPECLGLKRPQGWHFIRRRKILSLAVLQLWFAGVLILVIGQSALP